MKTIMNKVYNFLLYLFGFIGFGVSGVFIFYFIFRILWEGRLIR